MWQLAHWRLQKDRPRPHLAWAFLELPGPHAQSVDELQLLIGEHCTMESLIREAKSYSKYPYARSGGAELPPLCVQILKDAKADTTQPAIADDCGCEMESDDEEEEDEEE